MEKPTNNHSNKILNSGGCPTRKDCRSDEVENKYKDYFFYIVGFFTVSGEKWVTMPDFLTVATLMPSHSAEINRSALKCD